MPRFSLNRTAGHWRLGINGHGSQFMSTQKLCSRRRKTFVDTLPDCITFNSSSPGVSMMILGERQCRVGVCRTADEELANATTMQRNAMKQSRNVGELAPTIA